MTNQPSNHAEVQAINYIAIPKYNANRETTHFYQSMFEQQEILRNNLLRRQKLHQASVYIYTSHEKMDSVVEHTVYLTHVLSNLLRPPKNTCKLYLSLC